MLEKPSMETKDDVSNAFGLPPLPMLPDPIQDDLRLRLLDALEALGSTWAGVSCCWPADQKENVNAYVLTPEAVRIFIKGFDDGLYPGLILIDDQL
jgi:hypothetical protein